MDANPKVKEKGWNCVQYIRERRTGTEKKYTKIEIDTN